MSEVSFSIKEKNILFLGATSILGGPVIKALHNAGANLFLLDINKDALEGVKKELNNECEIYTANAMDKNSLEQIKDEIIRKAEHIDVLINFVGGNMKSATTSDELSFFDLPVEDLKKVLDLNLFGGAVLSAQVFGKDMVKNKNGGSIIHVSSMNAIRPLTRIPGYSAAKAAVDNFTKWLATDIAKNFNKNIRVNSISPGFFLTAQNKFLLMDENEKLTARGKTIIDHTPMGRFGTPEEITGSILFLISDAAKFITGTTIIIDGGFSAFSGV